MFFINRLKPQTTTKKGGEIMKKLFLSIVAICATCMVTASEVVTLTVNGQGATKEAATSNALRSAIEQAFGVFVSANTQILNDTLVKDEIATISSGNIQQYTEISCVNMPNGEVAVTLQATVAINKLVAYAKSHGSSAEFAGQTFAMNMKIAELNKQNEEKVLHHTYLQLRDLAEHMFDWKLEVDTPKISDDKYTLDMTVTAISNEASDAFQKTLLNTLRSLSLTPEQVAEYSSTNMDMNSITLIYDTNEISYTNALQPLLPQLQNPYKKFEYTFRSPFIYKFLEDVSYLIRAAAISFEIRETSDSRYRYSFLEYNGEKRVLSSDKRDFQDRYGIYDFKNNTYSYRMPNGKIISEEDYNKYAQMCCLSPKVILENKREFQVWNLDKYALQIVKKRRMPEPVVYKNDIYCHHVSIDIDKEHIGSIAGFEVICAPKYRIDVEYAPWHIIKDFGDGRYLVQRYSHQEPCVIDKHCEYVEDIK